MGEPCQHESYICTGDLEDGDHLSVNILEQCNKHLLSPVFPSMLLHYTAVEAYLNEAYSREHA